MKKALLLWLLLALPALAAPPPPSLEDCDKLVDLGAYRLAISRYNHLLKSLPKQQQRAAVVGRVVTEEAAMGLPWTKDMKRLHDIIQELDHPSTPADRELLVEALYTQAKAFWGHRQFERSAPLYERIQSEARNLGGPTVPVTSFLTQTWLYSQEHLTRRASAGSYLQHLDRAWACLDSLQAQPAGIWSQRLGVAAFWWMDQALFQVRQHPEEPRWQEAADHARDRLFALQQRLPKSPQLFYAKVRMVADLAAHLAGTGKPEEAERVLASLDPAPADLSRQLNSWGSKTTSQELDRGQYRYALARAKGAQARYQAHPGPDTLKAFQVQVEQVLPGQDKVLIDKEKADLLAQVLPLLLACDSPQFPAQSGPASSPTQAPEGARPPGPLLLGPLRAHRGLALACLFGPHHFLVANKQVDCRL